MENVDSRMIEIRGQRVRVAQASHQRWWSVYQGGEYFEFRPDGAGSAPQVADLAGPATSTWRVGLDETTVLLALQAFEHLGVGDHQPVQPGRQLGQRDGKLQILMAEVEREAHAGSTTPRSSCGRAGGGRE